MRLPRPIRAISGATKDICIMSGDMDCPACNVALVMSDRQGIEIDYCPKCRGVWLDRGELDKIIERSASAAPQAAPAPAPAPAQVQPHYQVQQPVYYQKRRKSFLEELFD
jgi:Zn-finger nucleic acid-binding protein